MTALRTAAQQALEALEGKRYTACGWRADCDKAITALRAALTEDALQKFTEVSQEIEAALAEPVQEPVAWRFKAMIGMPWSLSDDGYYISCKRDQRYFVEALYTAPPQRKPLTEEEIAELARQEQFLLVCDGLDELTEIARAIERAHGIDGAPEERHFCPRCGKRTRDVHTCTPPTP